MIVINASIGLMVANKQAILPCNINSHIEIFQIKICNQNEY